MLSGAVPSDADAAALSAKADGAPVDSLTVTTGLPQNFATIALPGLDALNELDEGQLGFDGRRWSLTGKTIQQAVKDRVSAAIAALPGGAGWSVQIELVPPFEVCRTRVDDVAKRNAILFAPASATLTSASYDVLDELAADLALCPDAFVHVEGHTDADGAEDANLILSVSRAEAVVTALVERGVDEGRLYAEGFGESQPVASNDTRDGKQQNRRIALRVTEE